MSKREFIPRKRREEHAPPPTGKTFKTSNAVVQQDFTMFGGTDTNIFYNKNVEGGGTSEGNHSSNEEEDNAVGFIIPKGIVDEYSSGHGLPVLRDEDVLEKHSDKKSISSGEEEK